MIKMRIPTDQEWDQLVKVVRGKDEIAHWRDMGFWVEKFGEEITPELQEFHRNLGQEYQANRGFATAAACHYSPAYRRIVDIGFRPAFDFLPGIQPSDVPEGSVIPAGTLYMNGKPVKVPQNPVYFGDIWPYGPATKLAFGPAEKDPAYVVHTILLSKISPKCCYGYHMQVNTNLFWYKIREPGISGPSQSPYSILVKAFQEK